MPTIKLTQLAVDRIGKPVAGRIEYFDSQLPGFGLRVAESGHKSWVVMYRAAGKLRRYTIGTFAEFPKVEAARDRAREIMHDAGRGHDPAAAKRAAKFTIKAEQGREPDTVRAVAARFVERYCKPKNRSWAETDRTLRNHVLSRWGDRELASITRHDIRELLDNLVDRGHAVGANRVLATVRKMFVWAIEQDIVSTTPCAGIKAPAKETERERVLTDAELTRLWRDEVATMRWQDIDLDTRLWTLPREATKGNRSHEVPLAPPALEILRSVPRFGDFVFTTTGERPISGYSKIKARADKLAAIEDDWRFHDLRRTAGTGMARLGIAVSTISRVLNHKEGGVTKIYNRYSYLDEKRHALEAWAAHVHRLLNPAPENVPSIRLMAEP